MAFFSLKDGQSATMPDGKFQSCAGCGLYRYVLSPRMEPFGAFKKRILVCGEAPGEEEDKKGKQWQGKMGRMLQRTLSNLGIDLFEDCACINAINCRPTTKTGANRSPEPTEIAACRSRVLKTIVHYKPHLILLLGNAAVDSVIGHRIAKNKGGITKWRGWQIPDRDFNTWICPTFHPSYIEREKNPAAETIWLQDLERALTLLDTPFPAYKDESNDVQIITEDELGILDSFMGQQVAIDFETTGLKPHLKGHRIVSCAVATAKECVAFLMPNTREKLKPLLDLLSCKHTGKIAANMKFEHSWSWVRLRTEIQRWEWDTMLAAHLLDNRQNISGLKFQVYINFGVSDYNSEVEPYLDSHSKNANAFNRITELLEKPGGVELLLKYNGLDSRYEFDLAQKQMSQFGGW